MRDDLDSDLLHPSKPARRFAAMAELRRDEPIHQVEVAGGPWYLARRSAVERVLPEVLHFGGGVGAADVPVDDQALNGIAEPRHGKVRKIVNGMVAAHRIGPVRPFLEKELCPRLLGAAADKARTGDPVEMMGEYLDHVPSSAISYLLGWPLEDAVQLYRWTAEVCERGMDMRPGTAMALPDIHPTFAAYIQEKIDARLALPPDDWPDDGLAKLLTSEVEGLRLSPRAVLIQLMFLLGAGSETTRDMLGGYLYELARDPELYTRVRDDRSLVPNGIEEALRIYSPTQFMVRRCIQPIEADGHSFEPGDQLFFGLSSANRDEAHFEDAARFDVERANAKEHLALGAGPHICLGAALLRMESKVAINAVLDTFESIELADGPDFEALPTAMFYGPRVLPLRLKPA